ncbi:MAG: DUF1640 domain-containing protein [Nitrospirota bacterium]
MSVITIPRSLRERLGDEASEAFAALINDIDLGARKDAIAIAEERFERRLVEESGKLRIEIGKVNMRISEVNERISVEIGKVNLSISELNERISVETGKVNERISVEIGKVNERISVEIANSKAETIKWMFLFWMGQIAVMVALFKFFIK